MSSQIESFSFSFTLFHLQTLHQYTISFLKLFSHQWWLFGIDSQNSGKLPDGWPPLFQKISPRLLLWWWWQRILVLLRILHLLPNGNWLEKVFFFFFFSSPMKQGWPLYHKKSTETIKCQLPIETADWSILIYNSQTTAKEFVVSNSPDIIAAICLSVVSRYEQSFIRTALAAFQWKKVQNVIIVWRTVCSLTDQ